MKNTPEQKNVITEKQNNVFNDLKKTFKRGQGLSSPPINKTYGVNLEQKENNEAVDVQTKRTARVSTYITQEASDLLDDIIIALKKKQGKKPKIAEVLEKAIEELHKNVTA